MKKLIITRPIQDAEIQELAKISANLLDISLIYDADVTNESIIDLIKTSKQLERLSLVMPREISASLTATTLQRNIKKLRITVQERILSNSNSNYFNL